jgi:hypothetical protein
VVFTRVDPAAPDAEFSFALRVGETFARARPPVLLLLRTCAWLLC